MAEQWEYVWVRSAPRHEYGDERLDEWGEGGWEAVNWSGQYRWYNLGIFPPRAWVLLKRRK